MNFQEIEQKTKKQKNKIYRTLIHHANTFKEDWICDLRQEWIEEELNLSFNKFYHYHIEEYAEFYLHHYLLHLIKIKLQISDLDMSILSIQEENKLTEPFILKFKENYNYMLNIV